MKCQFSVVPLIVAGILLPVAEIQARGGLGNAARTAAGPMHGRAAATVAGGGLGGGFGGIGGGWYPIGGGYYPGWGQPVPLPIRPPGAIAGPRPPVRPDRPPVRPGGPGTGRPGRPNGGVRPDGGGGRWWHSGWHRGYWRGQWYPAVWSGVWFGPSYQYGSFYDNPYYQDDGSYPVDYSRPIEQPEQATPTPPPQPRERPKPLIIEGGVRREAGTPAPPAPSAGSARQFESARRAFKEGDYAEAQKLTDTSLKEMPNDPVIHEFRALVMFAEGKYKESSASIYAVLSAGPGWDWATLIGLYPSVDVYTRQLRELEAYRREHPDAADAHFLLAYHYLTMGHVESASRELKRVTELQPDDKLAAELLKGLSGDGKVRT